MAGHARQKTLARPTAVAIHDDGNMLGNLMRLWDALGGTGK
jgi:hypothetical protein